MYTPKGRNRKTAAPFLLLEKRNGELAGFVHGMESPVCNSQIQFPKYQSEVDGIDYIKVTRKLK